MYWVKGHQYTKVIIFVILQSALHHHGNFEWLTSNRRRNTIHNPLLDFGTRVLKTLNSAFGQHPEILIHSLLFRVDGIYKYRCKIFHSLDYRASFLTFHKLEFRF